MSRYKVYTTPRALKETKDLQAIYVSASNGLSRHWLMIHGHQAAKTLKCQTWNTRYGDSNWTNGE